MSDILAIAEDQTIEAEDLRAQLLDMVRNLSTEGLRDALRALAFVPVRSDFRPVLLFPEGHFSEQSSQIVLGK